MMLDTLMPCRRSVPADGWAPDYHNRPQQRDDAPRSATLGPVARAFWESQPIFVELQAKMAALRAPPRMVAGDLYGEIAANMPAPEKAA